MCFILIFSAVALKYPLISKYNTEKFIAKQTISNLNCKNTEEDCFIILVIECE